MTSGTLKLLEPLRMVRPTALTMPLVMVKDCPKGAPIATANCPTKTSLLSPRPMGTSPSIDRSNSSTARSESGSPPRTFACTCVRSENMTVTVSAPPTTC